MYRVFLFVIAVIFFSESFSQTGYYFVYFKDKLNNPFSLSNPSDFLSQRSIQRRILYNITFDTLDLPVTPAYVNVLSNLGAKVYYTSKWLNGAMVRIDETSILDSVQNLHFVKKLTYTKPLNYYPSKNQKLEQEKNYIYGMASNQIHMLNGQFLHSKGKKGQNMLIAVLDAGFSGTDTITQFDSLRSQQRIIATRDFVDGNFDSYVYETHSHGTMVLATMAILHNGTYVGTAPKANYILIRTEDGASEYLYEEYCWVAGAEYADSLGADIINSSLGYTTFDDPTMNHTWSDLNGKTSVASIAATIAARKGMICCISAGNWGNDTWQKIGIPADADSVLTVGAVNSQGNYAFFSSTGNTADGRIKPDVCAQGLGSATVTATGNYTTASGTSFSSPILCGLVACLWQAFPSKNNMEIIDAVKRSASNYNNPDSLMGYGIPNFESAYHYLTGIIPNEINQFNVLSLYPVPTNEYINIKYQSPTVKDIKLKIVTSDGKVLANDIISVQPTENGFVKLNLNKLQAGYYFITIETDSYNKTFSIVKLP